MVDGKLLGYLDSHDPLHAAKMRLQEVPKYTDGKTHAAFLQRVFSVMSIISVWIISLAYRSCQKNDMARKYTLKISFNIINIL